MTTPTTTPDPLATDHSNPDLGERLDAAADRTCEIAGDNVWYVAGGLLLLGILIGAAATHATTPEPTVRDVARRSIRSAQRSTKRASRRFAAQLPEEIRRPVTLFDRIVHALGNLGN